MFDDPTMFDDYTQSGDLVVMLVRLGVAWVLGAAIGWERETRGRAAGLRTHMMVSLGACAFTILGLLMVCDNGTLASPEGWQSARYDPLRIVAAIIGGVGFLGAGAILQSRRRVKGLTTAAGIWVVASIGAAAGAGALALALLVGAFAWVTLRLLRLLERGEPEAPDAPDHP